MTPELPGLPLVLRLVDAFPQICPLWAEHLEDQEGEPLPHVFFGDLVRWTTEAYLAAPDAPPQATWRRFLDRLEQEYLAGDEGAFNVIYVSFLEMLPYPDEEGAGLVDHLGPALRAGLAETRPLPDTAG